MIFTHSYNKTKMCLELSKRGLIAGVYINKMHNVSPNIQKTVSEYIANELEVIFESPIYISSFVNGSEDAKNEMRKRNLLDELLDKSIISYVKSPQILIDDLQVVWSNYVKNAPSGVSLVLSMPTHFVIEKRVDEILRVIPNEEFKYVSWAIDYSNLANVNVDSFVMNVKKVCDHVKTKNILLTIRTVLSNIDYSDREIEKLELILSNLAKFGIKTTIHHSNSLFPILTDKAEFSLGYDNQTKVLSSAQSPFIKQESIGRKTNTIFSADFCTEFKKDKLEIEIKFSRARGNVNKDLEKVIKNFEKNTIDVSSKKANSAGDKPIQQSIMISDFREYSRLSKMSWQERKTKLMDGINLILSLSSKEREVIYKFNALQYKKTLLK